MIPHRLKNNISLLLLLFCTIDAQAQYQQQKLFPDDSAYILVQKLVQNFKPATVLDYSQARIKMYKEIYNVHDSVECVYSGHRLYLDPVSGDPIGYLIKNGNENGINCEHTFPQSKGAEVGNARSDMHHLYPARAAVNEARSNYPFGEIQDTRTDRWFYRSYSQTTIPVQGKDSFSESITGMFEPREIHKGNVARAIFYFFTMYELQADRAFFESMKPTLCQWHVNDPVDSIEWVRSQWIGQYQELKPNPFVLDCSLPFRCKFCVGSRPDCLATADSDVPKLSTKLYPNPAHGLVYFDFPEDWTDLQISCHSVSGKQMFPTLHSQLIQPGKMSIDIQFLPEGAYFLRILIPTKKSIVFTFQVVH